MTDIKLVLVGSTYAGKSALRQALVGLDFSPNYSSTIGVDFSIKSIDETLKIMIWDTAGQKRFSVVITPYFKNTHHMFLVFNPNHRASFQDLIDQLASYRKDSPDNTVFTLIATHADLADKRQVTQEEIDNFVATQKLSGYFEVSSKTKRGIEKILDHMLGSEELARRRQLAEQKIVMANAQLNVLRGKITTMKDEDPAKSEMKAISLCIQAALRNRDPAAFLNSHDSALKQKLENLQYSSLSTSLKNALTTVVLSLAGLGWAWGKEWLESNKKKTGSAYLFFTEGNKQMAEVAIHLARESRASV